MTKQQLISEVDIRHSVKTPSLMARKIWQLLFNEYRTKGGDLSYMDSLLCDLPALQIFITEQWRKETPFVKYWTFQNAFTDLTDYNLEEYQIVMNWDSIKLFKTVV